MVVDFARTRHLVLNSRPRPAESNPAVLLEGRPGIGETRRYRRFFRKSSQEDGSGISVGNYYQPHCRAYDYHAEVACYFR